MNENFLNLKLGLEWMNFIYIFITLSIGLIFKSNMHKCSQIIVQYLQSIQNAACETINIKILVRDCTVCTSSVSSKHI